MTFITMTVSFWIGVISVSAQWKRLPVSNEPPPARAYHSMTSIGSRHLLFGGFDGKTTFGDFWWLVPEDLAGDPIAKRLSTSPPINLSENAVSAKTNDSALSTLEEKQREEYAFSELQKKLEISLSISSIGPQIVDELEDKEFYELGLRLIEEKNSLIEKDASKIDEASKALRDHWKNSNPMAVPLKELGPLLRDYQRLIFRRLESKETEPNSEAGEVDVLGKETHRYYHLKDSYQLRLDDIPKLLAEYMQLLSE